MTMGGPARVPTPRLKSTATAKTSSESVTVFNQNPASAAPGASSTTPSAAAAAAAATAVAEAVAPGQPRPQGTQPTPAPAPRRAPRAGTPDPLSDKATAFLIRRTLCPQQVNTDKGKGRSSSPPPIEELLPPLTSRNDVDLQLYAFIAIIIREFVQTWYSKITPDEAFVAEIVQTIAHCTRSLEQRLRKVDLESLLFDELPDLLDRHVTARRAAQDAIAHSPVEVDPREIYHSLCPLPALSPVPKQDVPSSLSEQAENEAAYRELLVQAVLAVLLPTEDLENDCLTSLVGQIFSELIIGNIVANRLSEPWLVWEGLAILARTIQRKTSGSGHHPAQDQQQSDGIPNPAGADGGTIVPRTAKKRFSLERLFWALVRWAFLLTALVRFVVITAITSRTLPRRRQCATGLGEDGTRLHKLEAESKPELDHSSLSEQSESHTMPVLAFRVWPMLSNLTELNLRMPWLSGALSMAQWMALTGPGRVGDVDGVLDRLLSNSIRRNLLDPSHLPPLLRTVRGLLFPNNAPGKPTLVAPANDAELRALRRSCASAVWALVPHAVGRVYFGLWPPRPRPSSFGPALERDGSSPVPVAAAADEEDSGPRSAPRGQHQQPSRGGRDHDRQQQPPPPGIATADIGGPNDSDSDEARILSEIETGFLDVFDDAYCNKHLMYGALELVLVRLMPELAEKSVTELWEERLS